MIEQALLDRLEVLVSGLALTPPPKLVGVIEPGVPADLPALVVSIEQNERLGNGLGERSILVTRGALPWQAEINLTNAVLPADPSFSLISEDRRQLILPHGGLVRSDGSTGPLAAGDIQVAVNGTPRTLVLSGPAASQFSADPLSGTLVFGEVLSASGTVTASYFLGQWEQRVVRGHGVLRLAVFAAEAGAVRDLSNKVLSALGDAGPGPLPGLSQFTVAEIGSIGAADPPLSDARRRIVRFRFEFEQEINVPDSSGGVIQRIPVHAVLK
jgi:hypothetical protein